MTLQPKFDAGVEPIESTREVENEEKWRRIPQPGERRNDSSIVILTTQNFTDAAASDLLFVDFYSKDCSYCQALQPIWEQFADMMKGKAVVGQVDAEKEIALKQRYDITAYPTILALGQGEELGLFRKPKRDLWHLQGWVQEIYKSDSYHGRGVRELSSERDVARFLASPLPEGQLKVVAAINNEHELLLLKTVARDHEINQAILFGYTMDESMISFHDMTPPSLIILDTNKVIGTADDGRDLHPTKEYPADFSKDSLHRWLHARIVPALVDMADPRATQLMRVKAPMCILFYEDKMPPSAPAVLESVIESSGERMMFLSAQIAKHSALVKIFPPTSVRPMLVVNDRKGGKFSLQEPFETANIQRFIDESLASNKQNKPEL